MHSDDDMGLPLELQGWEHRRIFGITPGQRLARQVTRRLNTLTGLKVVADASAVVSDTTLDWLIANPRNVIFSHGGRPLATVVSESQRINLGMLTIDGALAEASLTRANPEDLRDLFNRKLRRRQDGLSFTLAEETPAAVQWPLFVDVYKGVTDVVTKYVFPFPAFLAVRFCSRANITPNAVTISSIILTIVVGAHFYNGEFAAGLTAAWLMTFLDTVDGKLARVTCTSSKFGDKLDHIPDTIHPPLWWICFAIGLQMSLSNMDAVNVSCIIILGTYILGRLSEITFKAMHGFNQYLWMPFDGMLRLIIARRNTILILLTAGVLSGQPEIGFHMAAIWSIITITAQTARFTQAAVERRTGCALISWMK